MNTQEIKNATDVEGRLRDFAKYLKNHADEDVPSQFVIFSIEAILQRAENARLEKGA